MTKVGYSFLGRHFGRPIYTLLFVALRASMLRSGPLVQEPVYGKNVDERHSESNSIDFAVRVLGLVLVGAGV